MYVCICIYIYIHMCVCVFGLAKRRELKASWRSFTFSFCKTIGYQAVQAKKFRAEWVGSRPFPGKKNSGERTTVGTSLGGSANSGLSILVPGRFVTPLVWTTWTKPRGASRRSTGDQEMKAFNVDKDPLPNPKYRKCSRKILQTWPGSRYRSIVNILVPNIQMHPNAPRVF